MRRILSILILVISLAMPQNLPARNHVLAVGLSKYPRGVNSLRVSANDAKVVKNLFDKNGDAWTAIITDASATCQAVLQAMERQFAQAQPGDVVIFYFSGHGTKQGLACYDGVLAFDKVLAVMKKSPARTKVVIVDACFSGKMRDRSTWQKAVADENVIFFLSSRSGEVSRETRYANSLFTIYLERGLRGGADVNRDRTITAREIFNFVHQGVVSASKQKQHPVMWGKFDGNTSIINWNEVNTKDYDTTED